MSPRRATPGPTKVLRFSRGEFMGSRWNYRPGEHVTFIGKTQSGKTTLGFELLDRVTSPDLQGIVLVRKPKDDTPDTLIKQLGYTRVREWPPPSAQLPRWAPNRPRGWALWPRYGHIRRDKLVAANQFGRAMADSYSRTAKRRGQPRIIFGDEMLAMKRLGLEDDMNEIWEQGSGMGLAFWGACQRPFNAPLHAYEQSVHLFIWRSNDTRNLRRYGEIGGIDPQLIHAVVSQLQGHECFYVRRTDYTCCVIGES